MSSYPTKTDPDRLEEIAAKLEREGAPLMAADIRAAAAALESIGGGPREDDWIELCRKKNGRLLAWVRCPECGGIAHLISAEYPAKVSPSPSASELRLELYCEEWHRFAIEVQDHSGMMQFDALTKDWAPGEYKELTAPPPDTEVEDGEDF